MEMNLNMYDFNSIDDNELMEIEGGAIGLGEFLAGLGAEYVVYEYELGYAVGKAIAHIVN